MALVLNQNANYIVAKPDFDAVKVNDRWTPPGTTKRSVRAIRAKRGGDVSQLGEQRTTLDYRMQLVVPKISCAYFQPNQFDLDEAKVIAARVFVRLPELNKWDAAAIKEVQAELIPGEDLTDSEIESIVDKVLEDVKDELEIHTSTVAAFLNTEAEGSNALQGILVASADEAADPDAREVAAGTAKEMVKAITSESVAKLSIEHLTTLAEHADRSNTKLLKAIALLTGVKYHKVSPKFAAAFEPFSTAVEKARVETATDVSDDVVSGAINYSGILEEMKADGTLKDNVRIEVVTTKQLAFDYMGSMTDKEFSDEELDSLRHGLRAGGDATLHAAAVAKLTEANALEEFDWIAHVNNNNDDEADESDYDNIGRWTRYPVRDDEGELNYLLALGKYALACPTTRVVKTNGAAPPALSDFATARMNIINHELHGASREVSLYHGTIWGALSLDKAVQLFDDVSEDIVGQVQHSVAHISYMKSGSHATAHNLGHTLTKLFEAIDQTYETAELPERMAFGTHFGTKPADQRAVALFLRAKYGANELSFAIGRRITPHGPGTVSMFLLNLVVEQLQNVKFFEFMKRTESYDQFKGMYAIYAKTSYLEAPYAKFFYGTSKAESTDLKQSVAPMFAYAAAIRTVMPQSTIGDSVALRREADAASANSITARLEVESFVKAYRVFLRSLIRGRMTIKAGKAGATQQIEDAED